MIKNLELFIKLKTFFTQKKIIEQVKSTKAKQKMLKTFLA
jgi:hypothetical protein